MHVEKHICEQLLCTYNHLAVKVIKILKQRGLFSNTCSWFCSFTLFSGERRESIKEIYILIFDLNQITIGKSSWFILSIGKGFIEKQLIYLIAIFQDNYNIGRDRFETDSANVMKNKLLVAKKQIEFQYILAWLSLSEKRKTCHQEQQHSNHS